MRKLLRLCLLASLSVTSACGDKHDEKIRQTGESPAAEEACRNSVIEHKPELSLEFWAEQHFTSPAEFQREGNFRFIVHALRDAPSYYKSDAMRDVADHHMRLLLQTLRDPQGIAVRRTISTSLISRTRNGTFGPCGLILTVPSENIVATSPTDIGNTRRIADEPSEEENWRIIREKIGITSPDALLCSTRSGDYNEILVRGTGPRDRRVAVTGIFVKTCYAKPVCSEAMYSLLLESSAQNRLPVAAIEECRARY